MFFSWSQNRMNLVRLNHCPSVHHLIYMQKLGQQRDMHWKLWSSSQTPSMLKCLQWTNLTKTMFQVGWTSSSHLPLEMEIHQTWHKASVSGLKKLFKDSKKKIEFASGGRQLFQLEGLSWKWWKRKALQVHTKNPAWYVQVSIEYSNRCICTFFL